MTTYCTEAFKCSVCVKESEHQVINSTNAFGAPDLDGRPPPMQRWTLPEWVQECPYCGYCRSSINVESDIANRLIASDEYKRQLKRESYPQLANRFLCAAQIEEAEGDLASATRSKCFAAWACDDAESDEAAKECRLMVAEIILEAVPSGPVFFEERPDADAVVIVDVLRRAGDFERASDSIEAFRTIFPDSSIRGLLDNEAQLIGLGDTKAHRVSDRGSS